MKRSGHSTTNKIEETSNEKCKELKKLRHQTSQTFERKAYLKEVSITEAAEILRLRLEMYDVGNNHGKKRKCECGEEETYEHLVECEKVREKTKTEISMEWIESDKTDDLKRATPG